MAAEIDSMPSPPLLPTELEREAMTTCQVLEDTSGVQLMEMSQGAIGAAEVSIKMLMSSKASWWGRKSVCREFNVVYVCVCLSMCFLSLAYCLQSVMLCFN